MSRLATIKRSRPSIRAAITLVELLIAIGIISILTAVALPNVRDQLRDQKSKRSADMVRGYINKARARAINSGRPYGVILRRAGNTTPEDRHKCVEITFARRAPNYAGDTVGAIIKPVAVNVTGDIIFDFYEMPPSLNQNLLSLTVSHVNSPTFFTSSGRDLWKTHPFLRSGDIVLPFGSSSKWEVIRGANSTFASVTNTQLDLAPIDPSRGPDIPLLTETQYKIQRYVETSSVPLQLPRGTIIDLVYSGWGPSESQFSPLEISGDYSTATSPALNTGDTIDFEDIWIMFDPSGEIESVLMGQPLRDSATGAVITDASGNPVYRRARTHISSDIYLLIGRDGSTDPTNPLFVDDELCNIFDENSVWVTINGSNGEVGTVPVNKLLDPNDSQRATPLANTQNDVRLITYESRSQINPEDRRQ